MSKHISYKKPICCDVNDINNSNHYPGWTSFDNYQNYGEENNDCCYLDLNKDQECWGQVVFNHIESSIDFVSSIHVCQGHKLMVSDNDLSKYISHKINTDIIRLDISDLDEIMKLQEESYSEDVRDTAEETKKFFNWEIAHGIKQNNVLKAVIFGYVADEMLHIYSVEVCSSHRKLGLGSQLINFGIDYAFAHNLKKVRAYGFSQNGKNILRKFNFIKIGEKSYSKYLMDVMMLELR